jgi:hypothetical protein
LRKCFQFKTRGLHHVSLSLFHSLPQTCLCLPLPHSPQVGWGMGERALRCHLLMDGGGLEPWCLLGGTKPKAEPFPACPVGVWTLWELSASQHLQVGVPAWSQGLSMCGPLESGSQSLCGDAVGTIHSSLTSLALAVTVMETCHWSLGASNKCSRALNRGASESQDL